MIDGIYLLLGSNIGDRESNLLSARQLIERKIGLITTKSAIYRTAAWGITEQTAFFNQVIAVDTSLSPTNLLIKINEIEKTMGRVRFKKWGERNIDIDILYYGQQVITTPTLTIPHSGIPDRRFTLIPLVEIAANFFHPTLQKSNTKLLEECKDDLKVEKL